MSDVIFRSRVDTWLVVVVASALGFVFLQAVIVLPESPTDGFLSLMLLAFLLALMRLVGYPCEYTLTSTHLVIRFGVIRRRISYAEITSVEPSRSLWSAPALSLRRVKVSYAGGFQLVSPVDREQFIALLQGRIAAMGTPRNAII